MRVADYIVQELIKLGVHRVYHLPGGFIQTVTDALSFSDLQIIYCLDEKAAGFAACGDALYTGELGVVITTAGPGSTNLLTAVASAWCDSIPLLVISGEINTPEIETKNKFSLREGSAQDVDMLKVARPIVKYIDLALNPIGVKFILQQCIKYALEGRSGPSWLILPLNVQAMEMVE